MAERKGTKPKPVEVEEDKNEPTRRQVLAAFELSQDKVVRALVETGFGRTPQTFNPSDKDAIAKQVEEVKKMFGDEDPVRCWITLDIAEGDKKTAINKAAGGPRQLGIFRAPALRAWAGATARTPPREIQPEEEQID